MDFKWHDTVTNQIDALRAKRQADQETFSGICRVMSDPRSARDGEKLISEGNQATLYYQGEHVCGFTVEYGEVVVFGAGERKVFGSAGPALVHMAGLVALADERYQLGTRKTSRVA